MAKTPSTPFVAAAAPVESEQQNIATIAQAALELLGRLPPCHEVLADSLLEMAGKALTDCTTTGDQRHLCDVDALIHGATSMEGEHADDRLIQLGSLVTSGAIAGDCVPFAGADIVEGIRVGKTLAGERAPLSTAQYRRILERFAGELMTVRDLIGLAQGGADEEVKNIALSAANALSAHLGAVADAAVDGGATGGVLYWPCGSSSTAVGKEVVHV